MQYDAEGVLGYRPVAELDPNLGVVKRRKFTYWLTPEGREALRREVKPTDDFVRAIPSLDVLAELKKAVEARESP
jgi:DNA-binding PadR family transcriptional regulator